MTAATVRKPRAMPFAVNPDTHEVFERVPDAQWKHKMEAWVKCIGMAHKSSAYHFAAIPSPMPWGHIMFLRRKSNHYQPCAAPPMPVWTDGVSAVYAGQRVGWTFPNGERLGYSEWMYGRVETFDAGNLVVRRDDGEISMLDPYKLA